MRITVVHITLAFILGACVQSTQSSKQHAKTVIPGSHIYIEQPENFQTSKDFIGIESEHSLIQFVDLVGGNYDLTTKSFTQNNFENKGMTVLDFQELSIDTYPAKLAILQENPDQKILQLVFGDNEFTVMAMAFVEDTEKNKIEDIKEALLSIQYDKKRIIDPFEIAFFHIDDSKSTYKYAKTISNIFMYSKGGLIKDSYNGESFYMVNQIPLETPDMSPKLLLENNLNSLKKNGLVINGRTVTKRRKLHGFDCYEEFITGTLNNEEAHIKMTCVVNGTRAVLINGIAKDNFQETLAEFDKLTVELKMK